MLPISLWFGGELCATVGLYLTELPEVGASLKSLFIYFNYVSFLVLVTECGGFILGNLVCGRPVLAGHARGRLRRVIVFVGYTLVL